MKKSSIFLFWMCLNVGTIFSQGIDYQVLKTLSKRQSPADNRFNKFVSDATPPLSIGTPLVLLGIGLIEKDEEMKQKGLQTGIAFTLTFGGTYAIKHLVKRPRPYITYPDLKNITTEHSPSFLSGHTSAAFSIATSVSLNFPKWYVIVPAYTWAAATGYSRLYMNVHYPSDVLAGAILGSGTAWLTWKANKKWLKRRKK